MNDHNPTKMIISTHHQDVPAKLETCEGNQTLDSMLEYYLFDQICETRRGGRNNPGEMDVILGRGQLVRIHPGNQRFRKIVRDHYDAYSNATSKPNKGLVVSRIIAVVRMKDGDFVRLNQDTGSYDKVSERLAREKVGQTLRDVLHMKYSSSTKAKKRRTVAKREFIEEQVHTVVIDNVEVQAIMTDLMEKLKLQDVHRSDSIVEDMFLEANMKILHELKQSNAVGELVVGAATTTPAAAVTSYADDGKGFDSDSNMVFL